MMMTTKEPYNTRPRQVMMSMDEESRSRPESSRTRVKRSFLERLKLGVQSSKLLCASNTKALARASGDHVVTMTTGHDSLVTSDVITRDFDTVCPVVSKRQRLVTSEKVHRLRNGVPTDCYDVTATCCYDDSGSCRREQYTSSVIENCVERGGVGHVMRRQLRRRRYTRVDVIQQTDELHCMTGNMTSQSDQYHVGWHGDGRVLSRDAQPQTPRDTTIMKVKEIRHLKCTSAERILLEMTLTSGTDNRVDQRQVCCVKAIGDTHNHLMNIDQLVSMQLSGKENKMDESQMIHLSVSSASNNNSRPHLVGSVSFEVSDLISKSETLNWDQVQGWYHLTSNSCSRKSKKNIMEFNDESADKENVLRPSQSVTLKSRDRWFSGHHVTVVVCCQSSPSTPHTYGFTLLKDSETHLSSRPVRVASVNSRGPAAEAGLLPGDQLVAINGLDVSGCSVSSVSSIINRTAINNRPVSLKIVRMTSGSGKCQVSDDSRMHSDTGYFTLHQSRDCKQLTYDQSECVHSTDLIDTSVYDSNLSLLNDARFESHVYDALDDVTDTSSMAKRDAEMASRDFLNDVNNNDDVCQNINFSGHRKKTTAKCVDDVTTLLNASPIRPYQSELEKSVLDLVTLEREFIKKMTSGIQTYSRPLRHHVIETAADHTALFQNVEKLVALSELHVSCLSSPEVPEVYVSTLGRLALTYSLRRLEAYAIYLAGLPNAFNVLHRLQQSNNKFAVYVTNVPCSLTLVDFLQYPATYLQRLAITLQRILDCSTPGGADKDHVTTLKLICEGILQTSSTFTRIKAVIGLSP